MSMDQDASLPPEADSAYSAPPVGAEHADDGGAHLVQTPQSGPVEPHLVAAGRDHQAQQQQQQQHPSAPSLSPSAPQEQQGPRQLPHEHQQQQDQHHVPMSYDDIPSLHASAVAHHGLQALEAASAAIASAAHAPTPLVQQYAQSASLHVNEGQQNAHAHLPPAGSDGSYVLAGGSPATPGTSGSQKVTRLRRACDMCSQRKVKCDESGPPCKPCSDLNVECTFQREMKRRGPPNKHAEAAKAKRARLESGLSPMSQIGAEAPASLPDQDGPLEMDAESIAPWPVLILLVDDFFTYIHPLVPFPHEPTFRHTFNQRADRTSRQFLALLASMIGVLVASFPRSARAHLKASHSTDLFPTAATIIERCRLVAMQARGSTYMAKEEMDVDDAATSYFLGLSAAYTLQWKSCKRYMAETLIFCKELGIQRQRIAPSMASTDSDLANTLSAAMGKPVNHVRDQIGKRIFWVMVAGLRSGVQLGHSINEIPLPPPTTQERYPDLPLEIDDEYIYPDQMLSQPEGIMSLVTGFNHNVHTYMSMNELVGVDMCYGITFFEWSAQKQMIRNALNSTKTTLARLPSELQVKIDEGQIVTPGATPDDSTLHYYPPAFPATQPQNDVRHSLVEDPMRRRRLQFEIQKANIYASQLATRSYYVERYLDLRDVHRTQTNFGANMESNDKGVEDDKDETDKMIENERELIVQNLLIVLTSITQRNMEPNGASLVNKIRQVASTLLNDAPERKGPLALRAEEYLAKFLEILVKLEKTGSSRASGTMTPKDEEEELQHWASLKDYQKRFAANGGFMEFEY